MVDFLLNSDFSFITDIVKDENGVVTNDLVVGDITYQNQSIILLASKGEVKEDPTKGVGVHNYLEGNNGESLAREIRSEFVKDGMTVEKVSINIPTVQTVAYYK